MQIIQSYCNHHLVITITGEFNGEFVQRHRTVLEQLHLSVNGCVLFDLSAMDRIDSSGIGLLVYLYKRIKPKNHHMVLAGLHGQPLRLVKTLRIDRIIECRDGLDEYLLKEAS